MGGIVTNLLSGGISGLAETAKGIIEEFHMSPEQKAEQLQKVADAEAAARQAAADYDTKMNDIAGQNIRADALSGDKFTSRARPSFMYVIIAVFAFNYIGLPLAQIFGSKVQPITLPADLLTLFGVCITGYVFNRTAEKIASLPGDSQVNVLGLLKAGNKS